MTALPTAAEPVRDGWIGWGGTGRIDVSGAGDQDYVQWLQRESMLARGGAVSAKIAGSPNLSQRPFAHANPRGAIERASVWFTAYPISMITRTGDSFLRALADEELWRAFAAIGVDAVHTGPVKRAGGISGWDVTPSVDGNFDRISTRIDRAFGTEAEFRLMCEVAAAHGGTIIDDIVPGHTGKGADFRLAEMKVGDYPGIYQMVEIPPEDWHLLPSVPAGRDSVNLDHAAENRLQEAGYIIGRMQRVLFARARHQGHELECHRHRHRGGRGRPALGLPALLQGRAALHQLAGPHGCRHAAGDG